MRRPSLKGLPDSSSARVLLGRQLGRHTAIYAAGTVGVVPIFLVNAILLTHFLSPALYGKVAVLLVTAGLLTVFENLVTLPGTFGYAYRASDDEDVDEDWDDDDEAVGHDPRRVMGTGFAAMFLVVAVLSAAPVLFADTVAGWLIDDPEAGSAVIWMIAVAATGALWRMAGNIPRMERRPTLYAGLHVGRALLVVAVTVPLVASGGEVEDALIGMSIGTLVPALATLLLFRSAFKPAFNRSDLRGIVWIGRRSVVMVLAVTVTASADVLLLSRLVSATDVGLYRLATRFGAIANYFARAFTLSWTPLRRSSIYRAAYDSGREETNGRLITYYVLSSLTLVVFLGVTADGLVELAPPSYADAAPLIPILALAAVGHGGLRVLNRTTKFARRRKWYVRAVIGGAVLAVVLNLLFIPPLGSYGASLAVLLSGLAPCALMVVKSQRGPAPIPFETRRMTVTLVLAVVSLVVALGGDAWSGLPSPPFDVLALAIFVVGMVTLGGIPRAEIRPLGSVLRSMLPTRRHRATERRLAALPAADRHLLELLLRHRWNAEAIGETLGMAPEDIERRAVAALRRAADVDGSTAYDAELGAFLLSDRWLGERDAQARALWDRSDVVAMHRLELVVEQLRGLPQRRWVA